MPEPTPNLSGFEWWTYPRGWRDVWRCTRGRHRPVMSGTSPRIGLVRRCSCGATWLEVDSVGDWVPERDGARKRRKGVPVSIEESERRRREQWGFLASEGSASGA